MSNTTGREDADAEIARLTAEVAQLRRGGAELGKTLDRTLLDVLAATGAYDCVQDDGDGDWGAVFERLAELRPRAERAEAKVARVEAVHLRSGKWCGCCHFAYPCPTILALADPEHAQTGGEA